MKLLFGLLTNPHKKFGKLVSAEIGYYGGAARIDTLKKCAEIVRETIIPDFL